MRGKKGINNDVLYFFTENQLKLVEEAQAEYERGEIINGEEADRLIRTWLESLH